MKEIINECDSNSSIFQELKDLLTENDKLKDKIGTESYHQYTELKIHLRNLRTDINDINTKENKIDSDLIEKMNEAVNVFDHGSYRR